jgi:hypothetical protein
MTSKHSFITLAASIITLAASIIMAAASHAATITFDTAADFDSNFWAPTASVGTVWSASGQRIQRGSSPNGGDLFIYNTTSTGAATAGAGGTSASGTQNTFQDFVIQADHRASTVDFSTNSLGFWVKGSSDGTAGYLVVFRLSSSSEEGQGTADMRVLGTNSTATGNNGSTLMSSTAFVPTSSVAKSKDYTFRLQVQDVAGGVNFIGSIWDTASGLQVGSDISYTHESPAALTGAGQVGFRLGSSGTTATSVMDNFSIEAIPEPSAALLGLVALTGGILRRRK